jgi:hypothetical protein
MVALKIPGDSLGSQVISTPQVKNLLNSLGPQCPGMAPSNGFLPHEPGFALTVKRVLPAIERGLLNLKVTTGFQNAPRKPGILQNHLLVSD